MKINKLTPNLAVADVRKTVQFYCENLGFELIMAVRDTHEVIDGTQPLEDKEYVYAMLKKDSVEIAFQRTDTLREDVSLLDDATIGSSAVLYMDGTGLDAWHENLKNKNIAMTGIKQQWYGVKEFYIRDINGYVLGFAES
ncbi:MAG: VOC family protein [Tannerella sp.]|jgi:uncharacterized glyoxalase superfamily protein PhnB|nr:VOC family protein [Tannerella sp.]